MTPKIKRECRIQLQSPAQVAEAMVAPNPGGAQRPPSAHPGLKTGFFTDDPLVALAPLAKSTFNTRSNTNA
jgi:hypothetical protein